MSFTFESVTARIKEYEAAIEKSAANHNGLLGALGELKNILSFMTPVAETLIPASEPVLEVVNEVVDAVDNTVTAIEEPVPAQ